MKSVVVVLGGNAFASASERISMAGQLQFAHQAAMQMGCLLGKDTRLLISHGNGPQVGHILRRVEMALGESYRIPLEVCVAESEGELGFVLGQALRNASRTLGEPRDVVTLLTQVIVDANDRAFSQPTKPIGPTLDRERAEQLRTKGKSVSEVRGQGFRRVVPSPTPQAVVELDAIRVLLDAGQIVVAAGGGGIPVIQEGDSLSGVEAVIDKDLTAALLAKQLDAELLVIVTCVPHAYLAFQSAEQQPITHASPNEARVWLAEGHFGEGSMQPKIEAAIDFASLPGRRAIICDTQSLPAALDGKAGTIIESRARQGSS